MAATRDDEGERMTVKVRWLGAGVLGLVLLALGGWFWQRGGEDDGAPQGGEIALPSTHGDFALSALGEEQLAAIYFGYTYCPDVCPMTLAVVRQALGQLEPALAERVVPVMISVDPERDTLERLEEYMDYFGDEFIGVRGSEAQLAEVAERYGIFWRRVEMEESAMGYTVDHGASLYLVDRHGEIRRRVLYSSTPHALVEALRQELGEG